MRPALRAPALVKPVSTVAADFIKQDEDVDEEEVLKQAMEEWGVGALAANPAEPIPLGDETSRWVW
jgi:hypothetical protein